MNNLTTRKIVLGMLMTFVMAFGVLGNADAINGLTRTSGDLQTVTGGNDYQIRFSVTLQSPSRIPGYRPVPSRDESDPPVSVSAADRTNMFYDDDPDIDYIHGTTARVPYADAHNYDQESIKISVSEGSIKKVGNYDASGTMLNMYERTHNTYSTTSNPHQRLSGSVDLTLTAPTTPAVVTIMITPTTDGPAVHAEPPNLIFTIYVVGPLNAVGTTDVVEEGVERVSDESDMRIDSHFKFNPANHEPVYYSVEGSGRLYVSLASDRKTSPTNSLLTSSSAPVYLDTNGGSSKVTAYISGSGDTATVLYAFSGGRLSELPQIEVQNGNNQTGAPEGQLDDYFEVRVTDGRRRAISGLPVTFTKTDPGSSTSSSMFIPVSGTSIYSAPLTGGAIDAGKPTIIEATATHPMAAETHHVQTDQNGVAKIYYQLSNVPGPHTVTATAYGIALSATLSATASTTARAGIANLEIVSGNNQRADKGKFLEDDLVVIVRSLAGHRVQNAIIQFRTTTGILVPASGTTQPTNADIGLLDASEGNPARGQQIYVKTGPNGEAGVTYNVGQTTIARDIVAEVRNEAGATQYDFAIDRVVFNVNGSTVTRQDPPPSGTQPARLEITVLDDEGTSRRIYVNALNAAGQAVSISIPIILSGTALATQSVNTGAVTTITPPTDPDTYTLIATDPSGIYASDTETITVGGPSGEGTLDVRAVGVPVNNQQTIEVTVEDADGDAPAGEVVVTLTGTGISRTVDTLNGTGRAIITLPNTGTTYTLRLSADGYATRSVTLSVPGVVQDDTETRDTTTTTGGIANSVRIASDPFPSGTANRRLAQPLRVQVLDANNRGVANVSVTFEVVSGQGRLSQRGNGQGIRAQTNSIGNASANYTPLADGTSRVRAKAAGVTQTVTFTITAGAAAPSPDETTPSETEVTPSREIHPDVQVNASQRPPMLWVDGGKIYALVGADVQEFGSGVEGAMNITVGGGKVYWTEQTGESSGTINAANLDGSSVTELKSILAVPMGIAVDTEASQLYWTNSRGRIQRLNADGSGIIENVLLDLPGPRDIAVARGLLYWTQYDATDGAGNVGIVNPNVGQKIASYISTGSDMPGSLAIGGNKVYWTEMTGTSAGTINSANLGGTGATELASILAAPSGIAVDTARSKLYWTNSRGRVQRANLDGSGIQNVVDGLGSPGDMVLSNSIEAPAKAPTTDAAQTASTSKYDINGDGSVDSKDVDALIVAVAAGVTDAKYDVNGDGKVDIFDVSAVSSNRDDGAAAAPALLGTKLSIVQIDRLQDQIDLLIASNDRSPDAMRLLIYLQQLIVMARPEKTQLLANYPNPFNPETWIPYELATDTTVKITIYSTQGVVIRTLELGHQSAGYYTGRDRAAYWDGRNALGEQVASGIYFYQFETDTMSSMRKMVILK